MNAIKYLIDDALIMTITSNFRNDFKKLKMYFGIDFDIEFPELNFVYKTFNKPFDTSKRTIFGCTKIKFIFDMDKGERYAIAYPMINIYPTIITEYIRRFDFTNEKAAFIYFARITLLHELVHYFQLSDKLFFTQLLGGGYGKFDSAVQSKIIETLEYKCVSELVNIIKTQFSNDKILDVLGYIEILDFEYLFNKLSVDKYENEIENTIEKINNLLL